MTTITLSVPVGSLLFERSEIVDCIVERVHHPNAFPDEQLHVSFEQHDSNGQPSITVAVTSDSLGPDEVRAVQNDSIGAIRVCNENKGRYFLVKASER